ncbi:DeoR/GlpR family DNA-binding transcription regulator [Clostridium sp. DJ247]|uniref:DeoR/GlpR family DNA-binding transcription regulator n=1 Tax=Clostridium sp. DJ247 TaxID=2726188 RepID=UPI0016254391|nr:DeoR/GlpR family DNA-binding transcription regulator [Clostridium sp. DJ247]MBC2579443.1 DeoR/GlpR transcriptional regulator [Clostridium sp. DJ247]
MLAQERQEEILKLIKEHKNIKTSQLMEMFNVSNETIRRDLDYLEQQGCLKKVYGGAILTKKLSWEPPLNERTLIKRKEKLAIARECAKIINDDEIIFIDSGTTPLEVVKNLKNKRNLTIFTISLPVANFVINELDAKCIILGGEVRKKEQSLNGPITELILNNLHFDKAILSAGGIDSKIGLTDYDLNDVSVKKKVVHSVDETIVVADSSKFGVKALAQVAALNELSVIITDENIDKEWQDTILKHGVDLITACID